MMIGRAGPATTSVSTADADSITVRGRDLCGDLMGRLTFTDYFFLLVTGEEPTPLQREFLDLLLISIAEHGLVPTNQAARMTLAADPNSIQSAVAAGILGCGTVVLGTAQSAGDCLRRALARAEETEDSPEEALRAELEAIRAVKGPAPGFGHPLHKPIDPRAQRILSLAEEKGAAGTYVSLARAAEALVPEVWGRTLPMNVSMAIAAVLLDLGFPPAMLKGIPILARTASLIAHLGEEQQRPIGFLMAGHAEAAITYEAAE